MLMNLCINHISTIFLWDETNVSYNLFEVKAMWAENDISLHIIIQVDSDIGPVKQFFKH